MQIRFSYDKKKVIQALRYHFISRKEIRLMMILVNVFAIAAAVLFYSKKIRPEPFFLGSFIWIGMMVAVWYILPYSIFKKSPTFKQTFSMEFTPLQIRLENEVGRATWNWQDFVKFLESPHFFHLYFTEKSFFIVPKENMTEDFRHELRGLLNTKIGDRKK